MNKVCKCYACNGKGQKIDWSKIKKLIKIYFSATPQSEPIYKKCEQCNGYGGVLFLGT